MITILNASIVLLVGSIIAGFIIRQTINEVLITISFIWIIVSFLVIPIFFMSHLSDSRELYSQEYEKLAENEDPKMRTIVSEYLIDDGKILRWEYKEIMEKYEEHCASVWKQKLKVPK